MKKQTEQLIARDQQLFFESSYAYRSGSLAGFHHAPSAAPAEIGRRGVLSAREREVLHWIAQGKTGPEIAVILGISLCTVRVHIRHLLDRLGAANVAHLVAQAFRSGVLPTAATSPGPAQQAAERESGSLRATR